MKNLWSGRFEKGMNKYVEEFNASINFDNILYEYDIQGSIAHAKMLEKQGLVNSEEKEEIINGLKEIKEEMDQEKIDFRSSDEDIHMAIEKLLINKIGETGKKLHTARSRNDQSALDVKLYLRDKLIETINLLIDLQKVLIKKSTEEIDVILPGFTHLQHAQPINCGFYFMAYFQMIKRDIERMISSYERLNRNPLGACALAGTTLPIDRDFTTKLLKFDKATENAMDTVSDRDHILEYLFNGATCMMHFSRLAEEIIIYNSQEFMFFKIDDSFCTGSSIMPQKKNPDIAELIRGKSGRVYGNLMNLFTVMKGTPLAFNKDFQEDKEPLFDTIDTLNSSIFILARMLEKTEVNKESVENHLKKGFINSTDIAEFFVLKGIPFRTSHELVGKMVKYCENNNKLIETLTEEDLKKLDVDLTLEDLKNFKYEKCVENRKSYGGTSKVDVLRQIEEGKTFINNAENFIKSL